ncbi:hypothetical protein [Blastopirellula retiformator]|uniref:Uncharacterized protein n=1 Tax=Blastopirellula retiformator TaxID=2527970 RepID=A0A5C5V339_9BACT|nr:hypothetical protein [Blastopirellula retiformator]TWT32152.1 hypothetical protein Enr8_40790 [Blastopirellula retiformator]
MRTAWTWLIVGFCLSLSQTALAAPWEFDPYRVEVWIAADDPRLLSDSAQQQVREKIEQRSWIAAKAVWQVDVLPCPAPLRWDAFHKLGEMTQPVNPQTADAPVDKIILVTIQSQSPQLQMAARQFDVRTQRWSGVHREQIGSLRLVSITAVDLLRRCFEPIGKIERIDESEALVVMKAQGLADTPDSPAIVPNGSALTVAMRRLNRTGQLEKNGVQMIDWTVLEVLADQFNFKKCEILSGFRRPLSGRKSIRVERLAVAVKPAYQQTELHVRSREGSPLPGYEIYAKDTQSGESERLAATDDHGVVGLPQDPQHPFRLLYVRSGGSLLARLPLVPGLESELTATVTDNARQVEAEGFVLGWRRKMLDVIARRELIADRIRRRIEEGDVEGAEKWLVEMQEMTKINDLLYQFRQAKNDFLEGGDASDQRTSAQITQLFDKAQQLASKSYNRNLERDLADEVQKMRKASDSFGGDAAAPTSSDDFGK